MIPLWQQILIKFGIIPPPLTWEPEYEQVYISFTWPDGSKVQYPMDPHEQVTADTAEHLRAIYDPQGRVVEHPILGEGGPEVGPTLRFLMWPNGILILASALAKAWDQYPLDPIQADLAVKKVIAGSGAA